MSHYLSIGFQILKVIYLVDDITTVLQNDISALLLKACHSFQYPLGVCRLPEGYKKQEIWRVF
jgi:hypothetical protein